RRLNKFCKNIITEFGIELMIKIIGLLYPRIRHHFHKGITNSFSIFNDKKEKNRNNKSPLKERSKKSRDLENDVFGERLSIIDHFINRTSFYFIIQMSKDF